jgi:hypothetical protein
LVMAITSTEILMEYRHIRNERNRRSERKTMPMSIMLKNQADTHPCRIVQAHDGGILFGHGH